MQDLSTVISAPGRSISFTIASPIFLSFLAIVSTEWLPLWTSFQVWRFIETHSDLLTSFAFFCKNLISWQRKSHYCFNRSGGKVYNRLTMAISNASLQFIIYKSSVISPIWIWKGEESLLLSTFSAWKCESFCVKPMQFGNRKGMLSAFLHCFILLLRNGFLALWCKVCTAKFVLQTL